MPVEGGVLAQPWGLLVICQDMILYAKAYDLYASDEKHAPDDVKRIVMETLAASLKD